MKKTNYTKYSERLWEQEYTNKEISDILKTKRESGKTSGMWKYVGIPYLVKIGKHDELYDWEKQWFNNGIGIRWDKNGNRINK